MILDRLISKCINYAVGIVLTLGVLAGAAPTAAAENSPIQFPRSNTANVGVVIRDLTSGKDVVSYNADKMLTPASILKCVTAASVFLAQKEDSCFQTVFATEGTVDSDSTLLGNIVIRAVGDPSFYSRHFPDRMGVADSIVARLQRAGVRTVAGSIEIDSVAFREQGPGSKWELEDLKWSYGAGLYPINYKDNASSGDRVLEDPGEEFVIDLEARLNESGIQVVWEDFSQYECPARPLDNYYSPSGREIMRPMLVESHNLFAEGMLRSLAPRGMVKDALEREYALLRDAGLDTDQLQAYDGSGLTRANSASPRFMTELLQKMAYRPDGAGYVALFPKVGSEGTVKKLLVDTPLQDRLVLKSGSMKGVYCYAGYLLGPSGLPTHSVVIMINGFTCPRAAVKKGIESFLLRQLVK